MRNKLCNYIKAILTMNFLEAMQNRYATKIYDNTKKINHKSIEELKQILHLSPSSINGQPWQFTFVKDTVIKNKLAEASRFNEDRVKNSDILVVFSAIDKVDLFEKQIKECLPEGAANYFDKMIKPKEEDDIKNWLQKQVYLASGIFLSACATMKIDATPMEGIETDKYNLIINPDGNYTTLFSISIGYRDSEDSFQPDKKPKERMVFNKVIRDI